MTYGYKLEGCSPISIAPKWRADSMKSCKKKDYLRLNWEGMKIVKFVQKINFFGYYTTILIQYYDKVVYRQLLSHIYYITNQDHIGPKSYLWVRLL